MHKQQNLQRRLSVVGKLVLSLMFALLLLASPLVAWGSQNGPVFFVDDDNPPSDDCDGDYHFHSLAAVFAAMTFPKIGENDTVIVDPGSYSASVTYAAGECEDIAGTAIDIAQKGIILEAPEGRDLTKFSGAFIINGKEVQVIGFDLDATGLDFGFVVLNDHVVLRANKAHNATMAGVLVDGGSDEVIIEDNEVFNNGTDGIFITGDSDNGTVQNNQVRSNGAIGILVSGASDRISVSDNDVSLNQSEGIKVQGSDEARVANNTVNNNALDGIRFEDTTDGTVLGNTVNASGGYGVALVDSDNNTVRQNTVNGNDGGGVALRGSQGSSKRNIVDGNTISGNIRAGSEGVLLEGDASSNVILGNTITNNSFGVRLKATSTGSAPGSNVIDNNQIMDSPEDGIEVTGSAGRNQLSRNTLSRNNKAGIRAVNTTGNDEIKNNTINSNGHQGILLDGSPRNTVSDNEIGNNGREGIAMVNGSSNNNVLNNMVIGNRSDGISVLSASNGNDLEGNTIRGNRRDGVRLDAVENVDLRGNTVEGNIGLGVSIFVAISVDVEGNRITNNNKGGIVIEGSSVLDIEQNNIANNVQFGLAIDQAWPPIGTQPTVDFKADRNWWGDARGPAGVFEGAGNAALGVHVEHVFPWLPAPFQQLQMGSTTGEIFDDFGAGNQSEFIAMDKADLDVSFFNMPREGDGVVIASKRRSLDGIELANAIKAVNLLVSGLSGGDTVIELSYNADELPDGVNADTLRLYYFDGSSWVQMEGRSRSNVNIVEGEVPVQALRDGVIIALAPGGN